MTRRPLLVAVDGSPGSLKAVALACVRARDGEPAPVVVLTALPPMPSSRFTTRAMIRDHHERLAAEIFAKVEKVARRHGVEIQKLSAVGLPAEVIIAQARRLRAREIIMGSRGLGRMKGLLLGSVAMKVAQLAPVPITLVK